MKVQEIEGLRDFVWAELARQNLKPEQLSERSGIDSGTLSRMLRKGGTSPRLDSLAKLARGLGFDFYSFILAAAGLQDVRGSEMMQVFQHLRPEHQQLLLEIAWRFDEAGVSERVVKSEVYHEP